MAVARTFAALVLAWVACAHPTRSERRPMAENVIYEQSWTGGTFTVTTPDSGDGNYPLTSYREQVKTVDGAGPSGQRVIDTDDYGASALDELGIGPSSGYFDARGNNDGTGVYYEYYAKHDTDAESEIGNFAFPINLGVGSVINARRFFQTRHALTEGKLYLWVRGDNEVDTGVTISADNAWHKVIVQIVPSSDNGDSMQDGKVRLWFDKPYTDPPDYETLTSWAWVPEATNPLFNLDLIYYGHFGILPTTGTRIFTVSEDEPLDLPIDESTPCCGDKVSPTSGGGVGAALGENPFQALQPWTPSCAGGGTVPTASDLTDAEDWSV